MGNKPPKKEPSLAKPGLTIRAHLASQQSPVTSEKEKDRPKPIIHRTFAVRTVPFEDVRSRSKELSFNDIHAKVFKSDDQTRNFTNEVTEQNLVAKTKFSIDEQVHNAELLVNEFDRSPLTRKKLKPLVMEQEPPPAEPLSPRTYRNTKTKAYREAMKLILEKQKEYLYNLQMAKEQTKYRNKVLNGSPVEDRSRKEDDYKGHSPPGSPDNKIEPMDMLKIQVNNKQLSPKQGHGPYQTFLEANSYGVMAVDSNKQTYKMDLAMVKDSIHSNMMQAHFTVSNLFFKDIFNYKLDQYLLETDAPFITVFRLPDKMKLLQKMVRLNVFKNELSKVRRADCTIKLFDFPSAESPKLEQDPEQRHLGKFHEEFNMELIREIGANIIQITKCNLHQRKEISDTETLIAPDATSLQVRTVADTELTFDDATIFRMTNDIIGFEQFRLRAVDGARYIAKLLAVSTLSESWNPLFYILQEFKIYNQHLYNKKHHNYILSLKDYFTTPAPNTHISSFVMIYDHYDFTLRDLLIHKRVQAQSEGGGGFSVQELAKIFKDVIQGLATLHKLGIAHRSLKPENIVYSAQRGIFLIANLSLAAVFNKEDAVLTSFDLVGTPFYMSLDIFADLSVDGGKLKFMYNPFKADVYSLGVVMFECLWQNIQLYDSGVPSLSSVFTHSELKSLDDFIELSENKHKQHQLFLSLFRKRPTGIRKLQHIEKLKDLLENMIFEDSNARFSIFQAKELILDLCDHVMKEDGELPAEEYSLQDLVDRMDEFHSKDFSEDAFKSDDALILSVKNSQFVKELNLSSNAERIDSALESNWTPERIKLYPTIYIEATISRIQNLLKLQDPEKTLQLIEEQLDLCDKNRADPEYNSLAIHCLVAKNNIMFSRSNVGEFFKTYILCDKLLGSLDVVKYQHEKLVRLRLHYLELSMNYYLYNDNLCLSKINKFLTHVKMYSSTTSIDSFLVVGPFLMLASLTPKDYENKLRLMKELEEKVTGNTKESQETLIQLSLFQVFYLSEMGNNIEAYEYSLKISNAVEGNFENRRAYQMMSDMAFMLSNSQKYHDTSSYDPQALLDRYPEVAHEDFHTKSVLSYFIKKVLIRCELNQSLKSFMMMIIDTYEKTFGTGHIGSTRSKVSLIMLYMKDLQYEQAFEIYGSMQISIQIIEKNAVDMERLYWLIQLKPQIMFEQGMYYKASILYDIIGNKVKREFAPANCPRGLLEHLYTANTYSLLQCYLKMRQFDSALPLALQLLSSDPPSTDHSLSIRILKAALRVFLAVKRETLMEKRVNVALYVNKIIAESINTKDAEVRMDLMHFLGFHVYLILKNDKKLKQCLEDKKTETLISREDHKSRQYYLRLANKRKQIRTYLKIWGQEKTDNKVVEKLLSYSDFIVKKLSASTHRYDKLSILKSFLTVAKAYLALGLLDDCLKNLSKGLVSLNAYGLTGPFLLKSKYTLLLARVQSVRNRIDEAKVLADQAHESFLTFFGPKSPRTHSVEKFIQKLKAVQPDIKAVESGKASPREGVHYEEMDGAAEEEHDPAWREKISSQIQGASGKKPKSGDVQIKIEMEPMDSEDEEIPRGRKVKIIGLGNTEEDNLEREEEEIEEVPEKDEEEIDAELDDDEENHVDEVWADGYYKDG